MAFTSRITLLAALAVAAFQAQAVNVTVAYQTSAEPAKVAQADNTFAKTSGATVDWRKFDSGASVVRALASGDVQIGNIGSSPLAVAASQQVPIEVFLLASKLGNSEALVVKKSITKPEDLIGKRIAVPFISTTHYSLLSALKHWGIKPGQVQIINLQPPAIIAAWQQGATRYGVGAGGSGHVSGYSEAHRALEEALADWLGYPRALLFISGFAANQALIAALVEKDDRIVADRLSHASLLEAASLSPAQLRRFTHNDPQQLAQLLAKPLAGEQLAVTEGIFSMDGDSAPLAAIHAATQAAGAVLLVDDAHGVGVVGDEGRGSCAAQAVRPELLVVTFGKAFGVSGAAVLCDEAMADYLLQFARHLIYSTAMPPAQAVALSAALGIIRSDEGQQRRDILAARIRQFREGMGEVSLGLTDSVSAIQPLIVGDNARALNLACRLRDAGCWATAIRPPTVPVGSARLRLTLTAAHHTEDINRLLEVLHGHSE